MFRLATVDPKNQGDPKQTTTLCLLQEYIAKELAIPEERFQLVSAHHNRALRVTKAGASVGLTVEEKSRGFWR